MKFFALVTFILIPYAQAELGPNTEVLTPPNVEMGAAVAQVAPEARPAPTEEQRRERFMSAVQFAIQESTPELTERSHQLVKKQFMVGLEMTPPLMGKTFEFRRMGNEVVFYMITEEDMRSPMQHAVSSMIQQLNGRVRARGRSSFYRTALSPSPTAGGYLETEVNDDHTQVVAIRAQSIPLRDLLKQLKVQLGSLSYLVPGECADRPVDWHFGGGEVATAKPVDTVMNELATLFNLKVEKRNNTHIFTGSCGGMAAPAPPRSVRVADAFALGAPLVPQPRLMGPRPVNYQQVYFPVVPLGE